MTSTASKLAGGLAVAALLATGAAADVQKIGEAGGWDVLVNSAMGPGCLIERHGEGWQVQIGTEALSAEEVSYLAFFGQFDLPVAADGAVPVSFELGGETFEGVALGEKLSLIRRMEGYHGAWVPTNNPQFMEDLARKETLTVSVEGHAPITVSLDGTYVAIEAMRECQQAQ